MSSETSAWAKEQRCGDPVTKAVLMEIANWAKPTGVCEFLSVKRIAEVVEVAPRTVQRHIARLENPDRAAGGLGMIRRIERHRDDGGRGANSFELIGYQQPLSVQPSPRAKLSPPHDRMTPGGGGRVARPRDNRVTRLGNKNIPPSPSNDGDTPAADFFDEKAKGAKPPKPHCLPADWNAPPVDDLPPLAARLVRQWPAGAYEAVCETFRLHWQSETRAIGRKSDWHAALGKWLITDHPKVMRDAKAGVSFAAIGTARPVAHPDAASPVLAKAKEDTRSDAVHAWLKRELGDLIYSTWLKHAAILFDPPGLTAIFGSEFLRSWAEDRFRSKIETAAVFVTGAPIEWVRFEVATPPHNRPKEMERHG